MQTFPRMAYHPWIQLATITCLLSLVLAAVPRAKHAAVHADDNTLHRSKRESLVGDEPMTSDLDPDDAAKRAFKSGYHWGLTSDENDDRRKRPFGTSSYLFRSTDEVVPSDLEEEAKRGIGPWSHLASVPMNKRPFGPWTSHLSQGDFGLGTNDVEKRPFGAGDWKFGKRPFGGGLWSVEKRPFGGMNWRFGKRPFGGSDWQVGKRAFFHEYNDLSDLLQRASQIEEEERQSVEKRPFGQGSHRWGRRETWDEDEEGNILTEKRPFGPSVIRPDKRPFGSGTFGRK